MWGMSITIDFNDQVRLGINIGLDDLASYEAVQSNRVFHFALTLARIAVEPCAESYKVEAAHAMLDLIRSKPKGNVLSLFGDKPRTGKAISELYEAG